MNQTKTYSVASRLRIASNPFERPFEREKVEFPSDCAHFITKNGLPMCMHLKRGSSFVYCVQPLMQRYCVCFKARKENPR